MKLQNSGLKISWNILKSSFEMFDTFRNNIISEQTISLYTTTKTKFRNKLNIEDMPLKVTTIIRDAETHSGHKQDNWATNN